MAAKPTKVYPVRGRFLMDVPAVVQLIATKAEADRLIESGAFTDNPRDPERDHDAPDGSGEPVEPPLTGMLGEADQDPPAGGSSDSQAER